MTGRDCEPSFFSKVVRFGADGAIIPNRKVPERNFSIRRLCALVAESVNKYARIRYMYFNQSIF